MADYDIASGLGFFYRLFFSYAYVMVIISRIVEFLITYFLFPSLPLTFGAVKSQKKLAFIGFFSCAAVGSYNRSPVLGTASSRGFCHHYISTR